MTLISLNYTEATSHCQAQDAEMLEIKNKKILRKVRSMGRGPVTLIHHHVRLLDVLEMSGCDLLARLPLLREGAFS